MKGTILTLSIVAFLFQHSLAQTSRLSEMTDAISEYQADQGILSKKYDIRESDEYYTRFAQLYSDWQNKLKGMPFETMGQAGKTDYLLLKNKIELDEYSLKRQQKDFQLVKPAIQFSGSLLPLIQQRRKGTVLDGQQTASYFNKLKKEVKDNQEQIEKLPKYSERISNRAAAAVQNYRRAITELFNFYNEYDPQFNWWMKTPYVEVDSALSQYARFLKTWRTADAPKDDGSGIVGNPIGRDEIIKSLAFEMISYTPEELIDLANKEFAWCEKEMLQASRDMGLGGDWKAALEKVKNDHVEPGKQSELIDFLVEESADFVEKNNMLTVPPLAREAWRMVMMSAEQQKFAPFFLGGEVLMVSFPTNTMQHEDKLMSMRGNNKHFARATVFHEVIPGHYLQQFMTERYNPHRQLFYTPFWMEGWALYWEMILWDKNFQKTAEDRVGMLFWRMHRCARIIFSLNYHLGKWTPQQCIDFLVDKVGHERANAAAEVRRSFTGGYGPLYQIAYMIGAKEFYALRKELVTSGKMKEKDFHDAVLQSGPIPVEMVRTLLTQQSLTREFKSSWKFIP